MNSDQKIEIEIFNTAWDIDSAEERGRYLDEACAGDSDRRRRIEALLQAYANSDSIFASEPRSSHQTEFERPTEGPGTILGPYKLLQQIGEGGMGIVYMAEQQQPVQRKVALKIIKVGMDTRQVVARFEAERQALAMMDHPNIAKVFDGGSTNSGRPYFVMELVQGVPITDFCDKNKLSTRERIELLIPVCQAIQSAHQKGIIHRDIKPSNVLVTLHHGEPMAKVIDFGVAKATNHKLTEKTLFTNFGTMIGTPAYMSPEQAEMTSTDVDTRTDVYSLGVLLYELLTGTTPFDQKELLSKGYGEMQRVIAEEEPDKPSLRMSTLVAETRTAIAKSRRLDASNLTQLFRGDLDCITMKCLEKDRRRRYDTPNELVADLKRHLNNEPVSAAPPTTAYRFQKFYRRKRALVHAVAAIGVTLIGATAISISMAVRMSQLRNDSLNAEKNARTQAAIAEAVNQFVNKDLLEQTNPWNEPDPDLKLRTVVDRASNAIEGKFNDQPLVEASIRLTLSGIYRSLDDPATAKRHSDRARELYERELGKEHADTLKATVGTVRDLIFESHRDKSKTEQACALASEVLSVSRRVLGEEHRITLQAMRALTDALGSASRNQEAKSIHEQALYLHEKVLGKNDPETIRLLQDLAWFHISVSSQFEKAVELSKEAIARSELLHPDHPARFSAREMLSLAYGYSGGPPAERRQLAQQNLEFARRVFGPEHSRTIGALENRALAGETAQESLQLIAEAYQLALKHWGPKHRSTLQVQRYLAEAYSKNGDRKKAEELFLSGLEATKANFARHRLLLDYLWQLGVFYSSEDPAKSEAYFKEDAELARETQGENSVQHQFALIGLSRLYSEQKQWAKEAQVTEKILHIRKETIGTRTPRTTFLLANLLQCLALLDRANEADDHLRTVLMDFAANPPKSAEEWNAAQWAVLALDFCQDKKRHLPLLEAMVKNPSTNSTTVLTILAEYQRHSGDLKAYHKTYSARAAKYPEDHFNWYNRSAAAIKIGDTNDHLFCSREMLARFGHEEKDKGLINRIMKTFFLIPTSWSSEELAKVEALYDRMSSGMVTLPLEQLEWHFTVLSLADYRQGRFEKVLEREKKVNMLTD